MKRTLGTCYYPEHWPREQWAADAARMVATGLTWVRIGEFSWSRLEPKPGVMHFDWLDEAIEILGHAGLKIVLGTPTATPPRWMIDRHPDMLAVDAEGRPRRFGSRRHYCFSHSGYREECARIVRALAERYGDSPHVAAWQTDNEFGCHQTTLSYSEAARDAFRGWLRARYRDIESLNAAWGNVFWSMEYGAFEQIGLPNLTVTEPNPSHGLDFRRFSSDQVVSFNRRQADIIRACSDAPIAHNYMGKETHFDHFAVGADLDIAGWDSYPLGFLDQKFDVDAAHKRRFARQGDPDFQAFHHDLYRAVGRGRLWVMEQQPGPVNWAPHNPVPAPGMVRLWTWEAFAHGAEAVLYFRWRQAPMAQEQMHAGLLRPDGVETPAMAEVQAVAAELRDAPGAATAQAPVAIMFDYDADFAWTVQPHGQGLEYFWLVFDIYRALRALGQTIDILPPGARDFGGYRLVFVPGMMHMPDDLKSALRSSDATVVVGPRSGARDQSMRIPLPLPPALHGLDGTVTAVESIPPDLPVPLAAGGACIGYRELLDGTADVIETTEDGEAVVMASARLYYLGAWIDQVGLRRIFRTLCRSVGIETFDLPDGLRTRHNGRERFWFNYDTVPHEISGQVIAPVSVLREERP